MAMNDFYSRQYGKRWTETLLPALLEPPNRVLRLNVLSSAVAMSRTADRQLVCLPHNSCWIAGEEINDLPLCLAMVPKEGETAESPILPPLRDSSGLSMGYVMDGASVLCAELLGVEASHHVLDLCAAPGGKSLILAQKMFRDEKAPESLHIKKKAFRDDEQDSADGKAESDNDSGSISGSSDDDDDDDDDLEVMRPKRGSLVCNEIQAARRRRLQTVVHEHVPHFLRSRIQIVGIDGERGGGVIGKDRFDRVLLDAPCSTDRHCLWTAAAASEWSVAQLHRDAARQLNLLSTAARACRSGGRIMYSTCSLANIENDDVVAKFLCSKAGKGFRLVREQDLPIPLPPFCERTAAGGWMVLPDGGSKYGPMYMALLQKS